MPLGEPPCMVGTAAVTSLTVLLEFYTVCKSSFTLSELSFCLGICASTCLLASIQYNKIVL